MVYKRDLKRLLCNDDDTRNNSNIDLGTILKIIATVIIGIITFGIFMISVVYLNTFDFKYTLEVLKAYFIVIGAMSIAGLFIFGVVKLVQFIWDL